MLRVSAHAFRSDVGMQRNANEDSYFTRAPVFAVADGMGGAQAGEVASQLAVEEFEGEQRIGEAPEAWLAGIVSSANSRIHEVATTDATRSGMGTTLTAALLEGDDLSIAHVGDSRAYLYRGGELKQLTNDHSLVEEMRRQGQLTREEAEEHPQRSVILRALGVEPNVEIDTMTYRLRAGDIVVLCTDGLTTMVSDEDLAKILASEPDLDAVARQMIDAANAAGGRDNITVGVFSLAEAGVPAAEGATLVAPPDATGAITTADVAAEVERTRAERLRHPLRTRERPEPAADTPPPRRRGRRVVTLIAALALLVAAGFGARAASQSVYFLGTDEAGRMAIYKGLPYELPLGVNLYDEFYSSPIRAASVPDARNGSLRDHEWRSREDAIDLLTDLEQVAAQARDEELRSQIPEPPKRKRPGGQGKPGGGGSASPRTGGGNR